MVRANNIISKDLFSKNPKIIDYPKAEQLPL
jgi:hypothetical protein